MTQTADYLIIGGGLYGCSIAYQLALQGAKTWCFSNAMKSATATSKSCAIVRTHYSVEANLIHAVESLKVFEDLTNRWRRYRFPENRLSDPRPGRPPGTDAGSVQTTKRTGDRYRVIDAEEAKALHPLLQLDDVEVIGYDTRTGYCDPIATTAFAKRARDLEWKSGPGSGSRSCGGRHCQKRHHRLGNL